MINQLHSGDCLAFLKTLPDNSIHALITDPPYASGGLHIGTRRQPPATKYLSSTTLRQYVNFGGDHRDQRGHLCWSVLWLSEAFRVLKPHSPICVFTDWRQLPLMSDAIQAAGFTWRGIVPWDKSEGVRPAKGRFRNQAEYVLWGSKGEMPFTRNVPVLPGVYREVVRQVDKYHLTGKPTALMRHLVKICEPGGVILDPFVGSGSTLIAAALEGHSWVGCELSPEYVEIANRRLQEIGH